MEKVRQVVIQGYPGSFHDHAAQLYFNDNIDISPADSFNILSKKLKNESDIDYGIMAIENSIAGSILPNYRILREQDFQVVGEVYLRIKMNLMAMPGQSIDDIKEIHSHPMALKQCLRYLNQFEDIKLVESEDTALSAENISKHQIHNQAAIASERAADLYGLEILSEGIEDNKTNYTRFFVLNKSRIEVSEGNKASIWCRLPHEQGSLLKVLSIINDHGINLTKLQSYPVLGCFSEYFFHMDLEFNKLDEYEYLRSDLIKVSLQFQELGIYKKADISAALHNIETAVML